MQRLTSHAGRVAVAGAMTIAFSAILVRKADVSPATAAFFRCAYAVPVLWLLAHREQNRFGARTVRERRLALWAGMLFAADLIFWHYAIVDVGAGLATVLGNLQVVAVGVLAWVVLGERLDARMVGGVPVVLAGIVLISGVLGHGAYGNNPALGVVWGVLCALTYGGFILVLRQSGRDERRPAGPLFEATAWAALFCLIAGIGIGDLDLVPSWPAHGWLLVLALSSQVFGWMLISVSLPRLPAVVTSILLTLQAVGSVVLGVVILGEAPSALQVMGVALVFAGILVATVRPRTAATA